MIGVDVVAISRIQGIWQRYGESFYKKFLNQEEISLIHNPDTAAGFWATKEAVSKALGLGISSTCAFKDICIHKTPNGQPYFTLSRHLIDLFCISDTSLSISHDGGFAIAVVAIKGHKKNRLPICHDHVNSNLA